MKKSKGLTLRARHELGPDAEGHGATAGFVSTHIRCLAREDITEVGDHHTPVVAWACRCELEVALLGFKVKSCTGCVGRLAGTAVFLLTVRVAC